MPGVDMLRLLGAAELLGAAGLAGLFTGDGAPKPRVRSREGDVAGGVAPAPFVIGAAVVGVDELNNTPGTGIVLIGAAALAPPPGFGLAATTAGDLASESVVENVGWDVPAPVFAVALDLTDGAFFVVGDASTMRIGSSAELLVLAENDEGAEFVRRAGEAVISLRIVLPGVDLVEPAGAVTIGGSVLEEGAESAGVAAGGW